MILHENCKNKVTFFAENTLFRKKTPQRHNFLDIIPEFDTLPLKRNRGAVSSENSQSIVLSLRVRRGGRSNLVFSLRACRRFWLALAGNLVLKLVARDS
jgi:hypothetical protein